VANPVVGSNNSIRGILVLRPGAIGDTLLTFPALLALRRRFPDAAITVVGNQAPLNIGRDAGIFDCCDAFGAAWVTDLFGDEPTPALRARLMQFDLGVVWMHGAKAADDLASRLATAGVRKVMPLVSFPSLGSGRHLADHLVETLAPLGIAGPRPTVTLRREVGTEGRLAVLHPGAGGRHKRWPAERFAVLADRLAAHDWSIAVTRGPADDEAVAAVRSAVRSASLQVLAGLRLDELAGVLAQARLFVGNDSGITHLAALLNVPTVAIFGPFDPAYWAPIGPRVEVIDAGRSCAHRGDPREGCRQCGLVSTLDVETVWDAVSRIVDGRSTMRLRENAIDPGSTDVDAR
jgi:heptosyltransferase-3